MGRTKAAVELVTALFLVIASGIGFFVVLGYPAASKIMPVAIMTGVFLLSVVWAIQLLMSGELRTQSQALVDKATKRRLGVAFAGLALMLLGVSTLGFFTTYVVVIPLMAWSLGYRNVRGIALGTGIFCVALYVIFKVILNRPLPLEIWMVGA